MEYTWLGVGALVVLVLSCVVGYLRGFVKEIISIGIIILSIFAVWWINPYMMKFLTEYTPVYERIQETCEELVEEKSAGLETWGEEAQEQIIDSLPIPEILQTQIKKNNNETNYFKLNVDDFQEYASNGLSNMLFNGVSFFLSFVLSNLVLRLLSYILELLASLPGIKQVNRITGMGVGAVRGIVIIWIVMLVLTIFCGTSWGESGMHLIEQDTALNVLYNANPFVKFFMNMM